MYDEPGGINALGNHLITVGAFWVFGDCFCRPNSPPLQRFGVAKREWTRIITMTKTRPDDRSSFGHLSLGFQHFSVAYLHQSA
jgi:hypothetical protein